MGSACVCVTHSLAHSHQSVTSAGAAFVPHFLVILMIMIMRRQSALSLSLSCPPPLFTMFSAAVVVVVAAAAAAALTALVVREEWCRALLVHRVDGHSILFALQCSSLSLSCWLFPLLSDCLRLTHGDCHE